MLLPTQLRKQNFHVCFKWWRWYIRIDVTDYLHLRLLNSLNDLQNKQKVARAMISENLQRTLKWKSMIWRCENLWLS